MHLKLILTQLKMLVSNQQQLIKLKNTRKWFYSKVQNFIFNNSTFISPLSGRETQLFTRQVKVQIGKSTLIILTLRTKDANSGGK